MPELDTLVNPLILYLACGLGAVGIWLALPKRGRSLASIGITIGGAAVGMILVSMAFRAVRAESPAAEPGLFGLDNQLPSLYFYLAGGIALLAAIRMITHPRPVYSALYFVLSIIASTVLYLILSAEFMAFALIIIYAGAILITYLFVIMLATQAPSGPEDDDLAEYDTDAREPGLAAAAGMLLLATITSLALPGVAELGERDEADLAAAREVEDGDLAQLTRKVERVLTRNGQFSAEDGDTLVTEPDRFGQPAAVLERTDDGGLTALVERTPAGDGEPERRAEPLPDGVRLTNVEGLGFNVLREHPATIEIAGVLLLMAILGATVLARKKMQLSDEQAAEHERRRLEVAQSVSDRQDPRMPRDAASNDGSGR